MRHKRTQNEQRDVTGLRQARKQVIGEPYLARMHHFVILGFSCEIGMPSFLNDGRNGDEPGTIGAEPDSGGAAGAAGSSETKRGRFLEVLATWLIVVDVCSHEDAKDRGE